MAGGSPINVFIFSIYHHSLTFMYIIIERSCCFMISNCGHDERGKYSGGKAGETNQ